MTRKEAERFYNFLIKKGVIREHYSDTMNHYLDDYFEQEQTDVNDCVIPDVIPSFCSGFEIKIFESTAMQEGQGALLLNPKDMPRKNEV